MLRTSAWLVVSLCPTVFLGLTDLLLSLSACLAVSLLLFPFLTFCAFLSVIVCPFLHFKVCVCGRKRLQPFGRAGLLTSMLTRAAGLL